MKRVNFIRFVSTALALTVAAPLLAQVFSDQHGSDDFKIGIAGYTYRKFSLEETLKLARQAGVKYMSVKNFHLPYDATDAQMAEVKAKFAEYGIEPYILGPVYMKSKQQVDDAFEYVKRFGHGMFIGVPDYDLLDYMIEKVAETGIKVAIHTHGPDGQPFPNAGDVVNRVKDPGKGVGMCLDLGHSVRFGDDTSKDLIKYKEWIYDIHIKDVTSASKAGKTLEMGHGVMDYRPILKSLRKIGYKGGISLEYEKDPENPQPGVLESIGYFRGVADGTK
jgi:sugar phosphate isomerase/epimerase